MELSETEEYKEKIIKVLWLEIGRIGKKNRKCLLTLEFKQFRPQLKGKNSVEKIAESTYMREKEMLT